MNIKINLANKGALLVPIRLPTNCWKFWSQKITYEGCSEIIETFSLTSLKYQGHKKQIC
jgi:hypothetical protein